MQGSVAVRIGGSVVSCWSDYEIESDMLSPADAFRVTLPGAPRSVFDLCAPDAEVQVLLDGTVVLTGYVDDREMSGGDGAEMLSINGRDKGGRLVDESMPLMSLKNVCLAHVAAAAAGDWFPVVAFSNATNRNAVRGGGGRKARAGREPIFSSTKKHRAKVDPGQSRWDVLAQALEDERLLAWSAADGRSLIIGLPNYNQEPQYRFFSPGAASARRAEGNLLRWTVTDSVGERFSSITVCGSSSGDGNNYGATVTRRNATVYDGGVAPDGLGGVFQHRKVLIKSEDRVTCVDDARRCAERERALRAGRGHSIEVEVDGHSQIVGGRPVLFAFDTMASVELEAIGLRGLYLVTRVVFSCEREKETTKISLVRTGTELSL